MACFCYGSPSGAPKLTSRLLPLRFFWREGADDFLGDIILEHSADDRSNAQRGQQANGETHGAEKFVDAFGKGLGCLIHA